MTDDKPTSGFLRRTFISLRNRNFRLYFFGQLISNSGNWLTNVALILLVLSLTHSGLAVGILTACQYGPILILSAWAGAFADRTDKRMMLIITQTLEMLQSASLAVLAFSPHPSLPLLYVIATAGGLFLAFDNPLRRSFVTEMVRPEDIPNAVVLYSTIVNVSRIFGPALAGLLVVTLGYGWCFTIDAASYIAVLIGLFLMRPQELFRRPKSPRMKGEVRAGIRYILSMPVLWINFVMIAILGTLSYNFSVTLPLYVQNSLHKGDGIFTFLYSLFGVGAVLCSLLIAHRKVVTLRHSILGAFLLGITMIPLALAPNVALASLAVLLVGMAGIFCMNTSTAILQVEAKPEMHGRLLGLQTVLLIGTTPFGGPLLGWMADTLGGRAPILLGAAGAFAASLFGFLALRFAGSKEQGKTSS